MATLTAQILIGSPHPNHDGIIPTHFLFLSENDRSGWVLVDQNIFDTDGGSVSKIIWIPTAENMLEDALLMIAIYVAKDEKIMELAKNVLAKGASEVTELELEFDESQRKLLYEECQQIKNFPKIILTVLRGSTIESQLSVLERYQMDVEVCRPSYSSLSSSWTGQTTIDGSL